LFGHIGGVVDEEGAEEDTQCEDLVVSTTTCTVGIASFSVKENHSDLLAIP